MVLTITAAMAIALPARAAGEPLRLTWNAPAGCPSGGSVTSAALRDVDAGAVQGTLEAEARVSRGAKGEPKWKVLLQTHRGEEAAGERTIEAATCAAVAEATAVVLSLALVEPPAGLPLVVKDPQVGELPPKPPPAPPPPPPEPTEASPARAKEKPTARHAEGDHAMAMGLLVAGEASTLPAPAVGGALSLAWTPGRVRVEFQGRRWSDQSRTLSESPAGARFSMISLGGRGCWALVRAGRFDLSPCVGADLYRVSAPGYGAGANYSASADWGALAAAGLARFTLTPWLGVRAQVEALAPLARPTFVVEGEGTLHRPARIGAVAALGVEVLFL